jgi:predicted permease
MMRGRLRQAFNRFFALFRENSLDRELEEEIASHLELAIEENVVCGLSPEEARRRALLRFGGVEKAKEQQRDARGIPLLEILLQDVRYTFRTLCRDRAFSLIAVLILALGIGANVTVFSVVNTMLLRPLPLQEPQQLTWITAGHGRAGLSNVTYTVAVYEEFLRHNRSFQDVTSYNPFLGNSEYTLTGSGEPQPVSGLMVAGNFFQTLGVQPVLGRTFSPEECQKGGRPAVLLSHSFWRRQFASDPAIVGREITLSKTPVSVIGVLPEAFDFGSMFAPGLRMDIYVPAVMDVLRDWGNTLSLIGRLRPGVTIAQAQAEADILFPQLKATHPEWWSDYSSIITGLREHVSGKLRRSLVVLWSAVGLILLIVCVNLSNLMLARGAARSKEFAMRSALGASRTRLLRQLLTESLVLSGAGGLLGLGFASIVTTYLSHEAPIALPLLSSVRVDGVVLAWTLFITVAAAVLFGLIPGLRISGGNLSEALKDGGHGMSVGTRHDRLRAGLVISEVALACVLLIGAGLLLRSFLRVLDVDLGFQPSRAAVIRVDYDDGNDPARRGAILQEMLQRIGSIPGVESAGVADMLPLGRNRSWGFSAKGRVYGKGENLSALVRIVTPGYVNAMGMRLLEGRDISWRDEPRSEPVVIINQAAARRFWPDEDPVGRLSRVSGNDTRVIGIVSDVRQSSLEEAPGPEIYLPITQALPEGAELVVRTKLDPTVLASSVMKALRSLNPGQPAAEFCPVQQIVDRSVSPRRFFVLLVTVFGALGLLLASLGIYGVISYTVARQTQEIGIRIALGATAPQVQLGVIARTLRLAFVGIGLGALVSLAAAKWIASLLFATAPDDAATFAGIMILLGAVSLVAGYVPARRASRIDPMIAFRSN